MFKAEIRSQFHATFPLKFPLKISQGFDVTFLNYEHLGVAICFLFITYNM